MVGKKLGVFVIVVMISLLFVVAAGASDVNETIYIDAVVGEDIYREVYRDNNGGDVNVGFIAKRDGGNYPQWEDFIYNTYQENPRVAYIKLSAKEAGSWSFRVGVFETSDMSKTSNRLYTIQVYLTIKAAGSGNTENGGTGISSVYGYATVYSPNGQRVHLRQEDSVESKSLGLYYAGTEVLCNTDPDEKWVSVIIGDQMGYMKSEFLTKDAMKSEMPIMVVNNAKATAWLNLRSRPSLDAEVIKHYYNGEVVTVMGAVDDWYHVKLADGNIGYMNPSYLKSATATASTPKPGSAAPKPTAKPATTSSVPSTNSKAKFSASTYIQRGYTVTASVTVSTAGILDVNISIKFDAGYTSNDDIGSYNLYINGKKAANVPAYWDSSSKTVAATTFYTSVNYNSPVNSVHLIPVLQESGEYSEEPVYLK